MQFNYDLIKNAGFMFGVSYRRVFWKDADSAFSASDAGGGENDFRWVVGIKIWFPR